MYFKIVFNVESYSSVALVTFSICVYEVVSNYLEFHVVMEPRLSDKCQVNVSGKEFQVEEINLFSV
jgi:hypothetical protein